MKHDDHNEALGAEPKNEDGGEEVRQGAEALSTRNS